MKQTYYAFDPLLTACLTRSTRSDFVEASSGKPTCPCTTCLTRSTRSDFVEAPGCLAVRSLSPAPDSLHQERLR